MWQSQIPNISKTARLAITEALNLKLKMSLVRAQAQDVAVLYFSHVDPYSPNDENMKKSLKGPLLAITLHCLNGPPTTEIPASAKEEKEEEKTMPVTGENTCRIRTILPLGMTT